MRTRLKVIVKKNDFGRIAKRLPVVSRDIVRETLEKIESDIKAGMQAAKSGNYYLRDYGWHQASAPGEMPAVDYGNLIASLKVVMEQRASGTLQTDMYYAPFLELGTRKMAPRPFMEPALLQNIDEYIHRMQDIGRRL